MFYNCPPLICKKCGEEIPNNAVYCQRCYGFPIGRRVKPDKIKPDIGGFIDENTPALALGFVRRPEDQ